MKIIMVVKAVSEVTGEAEEWAREFTQQTGREITQIDPETKEGEGFCVARGIERYPAVVVESESDGKVSYVSQGKPLPLFDTVMAYC